MPKKRQGGDREATEWRQGCEVAQIYWQDAHIWLDPKVRGSAKLDNYSPIALLDMNLRDMKLLFGPLIQPIAEVLTRYGVVIDWQQALAASNPGPTRFIPQRQIQRGKPTDISSFDARNAFDTALH